ncbi:hypothetical protein QTP70_001852 [Hemibagrus guttatus]|uniref:Uncharacterized protein n=1 Tax=Hemibagrus guttatus TaxID=175788 RepID=A0AAE0RIT3_9TELE|nr:hypothetical protein QTP70_001852 [Hemibagrus guttatus]KAK3574548.1 hypothetical protein QTP86_009548 [Hemibagrus guttatus]
MADCAVKFRTLAAQRGWNDIALRAIFRKSLNPRLQAEMACRGEDQTLSQYITWAIRLDNLLCTYYPISSLPEPVQPGKSQAPTKVRHTWVYPSVCLYSLTLPVRMRIASESHHISALVDSGSAVNLIHCQLVEERQLPRVPCTAPLRITAVDNQPIGDGKITCQTVPIFVQVGLFHIEELDLFVISSPANPVILGFPWLNSHNPTISWHTKELTHWSPHCMTYCLPMGPNLSCCTTSVESPAPTHTIKIPQGYHDLMEVFNKEPICLHTDLGIVLLIS